MAHNETRTITWIFALGSAILPASALAYDCSGLPQWKRQTCYGTGTVVKYQEVAYENLALTKRDFHDEGDPWTSPGPCDSSSGDGNGSGELQPTSFYGAWHCGNDSCAWSSVREMDEHDAKNHRLTGRKTRTNVWTSANRCSSPPGTLSRRFNPVTTILKGNEAYSTSCPEQTQNVHLNRLD